MSYHPVMIIIKTPHYKQYRQNVLRAGLKIPRWRHADLSLTWIAAKIHDESAAGMLQAQDLNVQALMVTCTRQGQQQPLNHAAVLVWRLGISL